MGDATYFNTNWHPIQNFGTLLFFLAPLLIKLAPPYKCLNRAILSYTICETLSSRLQVSKMTIVFILYSPIHIVILFLQFIIRVYNPCNPKSINFVLLLDLQALCCLEKQVI